MKWMKKLPWALLYLSVGTLVILKLGCVAPPESRPTRDVNLIEKSSMPKTDKVQWCITNADGKVIQTVRANWTRISEGGNDICVFFREGETDLKKSYRVGVTCWNYDNPLVVTKCPAYFKEDEDG